MQWQNPKTGLNVELDMTALPLSQYTPNPNATLGLEMEILLRRILNLFPLGTEGMELVQIAKEAFPGLADGELPMDMVEFKTQPSSNLVTATNQLQTTAVGVAVEAEKLNALLLPISADPITPFANINFGSEFIAGIVHGKHGKVASSINTNGSMQMTIAVGCGNAAIFLNNALRRCVPLWLALTSNAPFWNGEAWGGLSARPYLRAALLDSGWLAEEIRESWPKYWAKREKVSQLHTVCQAPWAHNGPIRLRPDHNPFCLEFAPCDVVPLKYVQYLADLFRRLCTKLLELYVEGAPIPSFLGSGLQLAIQKNMMEAALRGRNGTAVDGNLDAKTIREMLEAMISFAFGGGSVPQKLTELVENGSPAEQLLARYHELGGESNHQQAFNQTLRECSAQFLQM